MPDSALAAIGVDRERREEREKVVRKRCVRL
jgi:hypothetical protein